MAGDWIKMRGALLEHPKVIALARVLHDRKEFREWLTPGGAGEMNGQLVSNEALRCVTTALLLKVWSVAREHGKFDGDDLVLEHSVLADIDQIAGVSGFGDAMAGIGWAVLRNCVILPNFIQFNAPLDNAARQREYRERHKNVTRPLQRNGNGASQRVTTKRVTREEKSIKNPVVPSAGFDLFWQTYPPGPRKVGRGKCAETWKRMGLDPLTEAITAHVRAMASTVQWRDFCPSPQTYLNQRRFEDGDPAETQSRSAEEIMREKRRMSIV